MFKNIILSLIALVLLITSGFFIYQTVSNKNDKRTKENALVQARKDCSDKIHPKGLDVYADYNQCMASKGFDEFKK